MCSSSENGPVKVDSDFCYNVLFLLLLFLFINLTSVLSLIQTILLFLSVVFIFFDQFAQWFFLFLFFKCYFFGNRRERGNTDFPCIRRGLRICKEEKKIYIYTCAWILVVLTRRSSQPETRFISRLWPSDLPNQHSNSPHRFFVSCRNLHRKMMEVVLCAIIR